MQVRHTFRHVESSEGLKNYTEDKLAKLGKYLHAAAEADVTYSMLKHVHLVEVIVHCAGDRYASKFESENMYASVDHAVHKLERQVRDKKDIQARQARHGSPPAPEPGPLPPALSEPGE